MLSVHLNVTMRSSSGIAMLSEISVGRNDFLETLFMCCRSGPSWFVKKSLKEALGMEITMKSLKSITTKQKC